MIKKMKNKRKVLSEIPLAMLAPSIITMLALCLGVTAIRYALDAKFEIAAALVLIASVLDSLDGRVARLLNTSSDFGVQLDSLSDLVSFGVTPGIIIYLWSLHTIPFKGVGWGVVLFYVICSAFRLARFNVKAMAKEEKDTYGVNFFVGIPMPAAAGLSLLPLVATFHMLNKDFFSHWVIAPYILMIGLLMVSKIPSFSGKRVAIKSKYIVPMLVLAGIIIIGILLDPWLTLPCIGITYFLSLPVSTFIYYKQYKK